MDITLKVSAAVCSFLETDRDELMEERKLKHLKTYFDGSEAIEGSTEAWEALADELEVSANDGACDTGAGNNALRRQARKIRDRLVHLKSLEKA